MTKSPDFAQQMDQFQALTVGFFIKTISFLTRKKYNVAENNLKKLRIPMEENHLCLTAKIFNWKTSIRSL